MVADMTIAATPSVTPPPVVGRAAPAVAVGITVVAWASAFVAIRAVKDDFQPGPLALGRLLVAALALGLAQLVRRTWVRPTAREWLLIAACGVCWFGGYNVALNAAEQRIDAGTTAMLISVGPILIALLAGALLGEGFPGWLLFGAGVAFAGAVIIGVATSTSAEADPLGVVLSLTAALAWAVGVLAQKPTLRRLPPLQVTLLACAIGAVACLPFVGGLGPALRAADPGAVAGMVYLGLVPTALAFVTWAYALSRMDAGRLGVTTYVVPPLAVLGAWPILGEVPPALALVGGAVTLVGIAFTRRRTPDPPPPPLTHARPLPGPFGAPGRASP
jgi:drug/metabolite transporter (DMT)-like permease